MPFSPSSTLLALVLSSTLVLAACDSAEERAEERYQSGLALAEAGDVDRAIVELRSVFQLNPSHLEARRTLANLILNEKNNPQGAYGQFLRLAEQFPDDLEARIVLGEIAFTGGNWDELERHGAKAEALAPDNPRVQVLTLVRAYRVAVEAEDDSARLEQARKALEMLESQPDNILLRNVMIDDHLRGNALSEALTQLDWLIERQPDQITYWRQRLSVLAQMQDFDALEAQLRDMVTRFDEDDTHKTTLIRFYMSRQEPEKAEAFLRELAAQTDDIGPRVDLIRFVTQVQGMQAGRAEVNAALVDYPDDARLKILGAGLDFTAGESDIAIATLEAVLEDDSAAEFASEVRVTLARMLLQTGNEVGARARVEEVLATDDTNPGALKMRAAWLIDADDTDGAVAALRTALDSASEDAQAMSLMAQAYIRSGRPELARDFLALAVEASGNAPEETVRFARVLIGEERYLPAEDILLPALRLAPRNLELLATLGQLYIRMEDLPRVEQVVQALRQLDTPTARQAANGLEAERINRQSGPDQAVQYLAEIANATDATLASKIALVRARLSTGDAQGALELAREISQTSADSPGAQAVLASVEAVNGNLETAENIYEGMLEENSKQARIWLEVSRLKTRQGDPDAAEDVIEQALLEIPDDPNLMWAMASSEERKGNIDSAIAIYEELYARNSNAVVVANNLASLLSTYKTDAASLERAWTIARRLSDAEIPALQDTYGWLAHRRGNSEDALPYLESAANGLPRDPLVQFHLAEVYNALGRTELALERYRMALANAGPTDSRPQIDTAREQILLLEQAPKKDATAD